MGEAYKVMANAALQMATMVMKILLTTDLSAGSQLEQSLDSRAPARASRYQTPSNRSRTARIFILMMGYR